MKTYELRVHARDVRAELPENIVNIDIGNHTGYDLVTIHEDGTKTIQYIDLYTNASLDIGFYISTPIPAQEYTITDENGNSRTVLWGTQTVHDGNLQATTVEYLNEYKVYTSTLINATDSSQALKVFNQIKLEATLLQSFKDVLVYNPQSRNCNTSTNYFAQQYLNGQDVFAHLPYGIYMGYSEPFYDSESTSTTDKTIKSVREILDKYYSLVGSNVDLENVQYEVVNQSEGWYVKFSTNDYNYVFAGNGNPNIVDIYGDSFIYATSGNNTINAGSGNDIIYGRESNIIDGGEGNDIIYAGDQTLASHSINGGAGDDTIYAGHGGDDVRGGNGNNTVYLGSGSDTYFGGDDVDIVDGGSADFEFSDTEDNSFKYTLSGDLSGDINTVHLGGGNDRYTGSIGQDIVHGGADDDFISGGKGNDILYGDSGKDRIYGGEGNDIIWGGSGNDYLSGGTGNNEIHCGGYNGEIDHVVIDNTTGNTDTIYNLTAQSCLSIKNGTPTSFQTVGKDVHIQCSGGNTIILKDYADADSTNPEIFVPKSDLPPMIDSEGYAWYWYGQQGYQRTNIKIDLNDGEIPSIADKKPATPGAQDEGWIKLPEKPKDDLLNSGLKEEFVTAENTRSPLAVDLDGNGIDTLHLEANVHFDHDGNGRAENTGWIDRNDGLLVRDINGDGQIDKGAELFGDNTILSNGKKAANGFEALKDLDSNSDGIFDENDTAFTEIKIWRDSNSNGQVDDGELMSLSDVGIVGIRLGYSTSDDVDENKNAHTQIGSFIKTDGTDGVISDIWFQTDLMNTTEKSDITIPDDIKNLPDVQGFGNVHSLQVAMAADSSGQLKNLIQQFTASTDSLQRDNLLDEIIYRWADVYEMDPNGRNQPSFNYGNVLGDSRKLEALEEFMGEDFLGTWCWGERDSNPHKHAAPLLLKIYDTFKSYLRNSLLGQTVYKDLLAECEIKWNSEGGFWEANGDKIISALETAYNANPQNGMVMLSEFAGILKLYGVQTEDFFNKIQAAGVENGTAFQQDLLKFGKPFGTNTNDNILGSDENDNIYGLAGNDNLYGKAGNDYLNGGDGNDNIYGGDGNDILEGGVGNDYLAGGSGDDVYVFNSGFGNDSIDNVFENSDTENNDIVQFGDGITPANVIITREGFDLVLQVVNGADGEAQDNLRILSYFDKIGDTNATVKSINFADGTSWNYAYVATHISSSGSINNGVVIDGTKGDDKINGSSGNDILLGHDGSDTIEGGYGDDIIVGGKGRDYLYGDNGNDTYIYNLGDGFDLINDSSGINTVEFGPGITMDNITMRREGWYLRLIINGDVNQGIQFQNYFDAFGSLTSINYLKFSDGTVFDMKNQGLTLHQNELIVDTYKTISAGNDTVYLVDGDNSVNLGEGNDTVYCGTGKNIVYGQSGDDVLYGGDGNDSLYGDDMSSRGSDSGNGNDILVGGKGDDYLRGGSGNDTYVWNLGDGLDTINDYNGTDTIKFGAGITMSDLSFRVEGTSLVVRIKNDPTQGLKIQNNFWNPTIEKFEFADGTVVNYADLELDMTADTVLTNWKDSYYNSNTLRLMDGDNNVSMNEGNDTVYCGTGNNTVYGGNGNDVLYGGDGNDSLFGDSLGTYDRDSDRGNDILVGGKGDDYLRGGSGNDTYVWNLGDGLDTINDYNGTDTIKFGAGITMSDLSFRVEGTSLVVRIKNDPTQGLKIQNNFWNPTIEKFEFADGTVVNYADLELDMTADTVLTNWEDSYNSNNTLRLMDGDNNVSMKEGNDTVYCGTGNNTVYGGNGNDVLYGGDGNDSLYGDSLGTYDRDSDSGNDILVGGKGNDYLRGGYGDDTYVWNLGDGLDTIHDASGTDTIKFGAGIAMSDLSFRVEGTSLVVRIKNDPTQGLKIQNNFWNPTIEKFEFADGTVVNYADLELDMTADTVLTNWEDSYNSNNTLRLMDGDNNVSMKEGNDTVYCGTGNNTVYGGNGNDVLYGGDGNDSLYGDSLGTYDRDSDSGNDILVGGKGNDYLRGGYGDDTYVWNLGDGLDTIRDNNGNETIQFGEQINRDSLSFSQDNNNLKISIGGDATQGIVIENYYSSASYKNKTLSFNDGTSLDLRDSSLLIQAMSSFNANEQSGMLSMNNPTQNISEMYHLTCCSDLSKKAA